LEALSEYGNGKQLDSEQLASRLGAMVSDWERMRGGGESLSIVTRSYVIEIKNGKRQAANDIYLSLSPMFFFIRALGRVARKDWRETVTACGIFCERVVRNLLIELDRNFNLALWVDLKDAKLNQKNGRLRSELENRKFDAANLYGSVLRIYSVRSMRGPHDVPPPEPIQAKISVTECLPVYVDYLAALEHIGVPLASPERFIEIFSDTTRIQPTLVFGEETAGPIPVKEFLRETVYREGFFKDGRTSSDVLRDLARRRRNYDEATVKNGLRDLSLGRDAILNRKRKGRIFNYYERVPPEEYFKPVI